MNKENRLDRFSGFAVALFFVVVIGSPTFVCSQTVSLPPAAQEALDNGILAAKVPDYVLAVRYFEAARKIAPDAPVIYFNLGLAESKMPGRELRAICWFSAYLAAEPNASNAGSIREQIAMLRIKSQSDLAKLLRTLEDSTQKDDIKLSEVIELLAASGDFENALRLAVLPSGEYFRADALRVIAVEQAKAGDMTEGLKTISSIQVPIYQNKAFLDIADLQHDQGDVTGLERSLASAQRAVEQISEPSQKCDELSHLARFQIKIGDLAGARNTLSEAQATAASITAAHTSLYHESRAMLRAFVAKDQLDAGDEVGAKQALLFAFKDSEQITDPVERAGRQYDIFRVQTDAGDLDNALQTSKAVQRSLDAVSDPARKQYLIVPYGAGRVVFVQAQAKAGDIKGALKTAEGFTDLDNKDDAFKYIAEGQALLKDYDGANKTVNLIQAKDVKESAIWLVRQAQKNANSPVATPSASPTPKPAKQVIPPARTAAEWIAEIDNLKRPEFLDLGSYLKTSNSGDPGVLFDKLKSTASSIAAAQNRIFAALRRQAAGSKL